MKGGGDYDIGDLTALLRKDQKPDLDGMVGRVIDGFRFLAELTDTERALAADGAQKNRKEAAALIEALQKAR
ncbi:hypothetical protein [Mesorhizobium sp. M0809]|uniref:hypothetical protein n=1 Tax=Mesorhizobium sp. M0809 TaxID=2957003 RepID=UPI00333553DC